jgi:hypothetical protein
MDDGGDEPAVQVPAAPPASEPAEPVHPPPKATSQPPAPTAVHGPY